MVRTRSAAAAQTRYPRAAPEGRLRYKNTTISQMGPAFAETNWYFSTKSMPSYKGAWPSLCRNRRRPRIEELAEKDEIGRFSTPFSTAVGSASHVRHQN